MLSNEFVEKIPVVDLTLYNHNRAEIEVALINSKEINKDKNVLIDLFESVTGISRDLFEDHIRSGRFDIHYKDAINHPCMGDEPSRYQIDKYLDICDEWFCEATESQSKAS